MFLRVNKGNHDISGSFGNSESFVIMSQASRMHKHPALLCILQGTVVADEPAAAALVVDVGVVQRDVDGVGGAVVMRPQERLLIRTVSHDKVHE